MSFSNPTPITPVKRVFKWAGSTGNITWYDRDTKERKNISRPFKFIVLDELNAISGYSKELEGGIWSNEVRNLRSDVLVAKVGKMQIANGVYDSIKDIAKSKGGKYTRAVYVLFEDESKQWTVGKIMMAGSALGAWFDFKRDYSPDEVGVSLVGAQEDKNGQTTYFVPVYDPFEIDQKLRDLAVQSDKRLQQYLEKYANSRPESNDDPAAYNGTADEPDADDLDSMEPIDLSEIPF